MQLTGDDRFLLKLTAWRENRGAGSDGMRTVMNVILNRAAKHKRSPYEICTQRLQFSSLTAPGDAGTVAWPQFANTDDWDAWNASGQLADAAAAGTLEDATGGATVYYAPRSMRPEDCDSRPFQLPAGVSVVWPKGWDRTKLRFTREIGGQLFFVEV